MTYVHTSPYHNPSRHKVPGFDHVSFENVKDCTAFKSNTDHTSIHKGKIFKHKVEMKKVLGLYVMENHFRYRRDEYDINLQQMAACNQRYYNDVIEIRVDNFTRAYCPENRYRMMSTQIVKSMNSVLLDLRKLPIAALASRLGI
ncbi:hypothetical protein LWI28_027103 [Acer negundo]|uniref:Transposase n=1 Tax=Acer negundo TaxID=4023 RepID=A0AAD5NNF5_ACENE|nr:hypothetical protein LWI28_027103 [Acer negundo]